ncbi:DUF2953 domain-containing protein [Mechercharimyces sp. CAU 1602]|uniref:DUF2953 domain-containing protein n=1 Tax=Mechercharimyces sp. CAU 1602 TaxID=2973933 RepID=UPI002162FC26|nr:DUF2953 domain-containing protein [Mechercharimyces sp. CAU 1602]MCS1350864.1 DUF2953 domain-containing protein [Mechercharimyces sp. CAU 1602]
MKIILLIGGVLFLLLILLLFTSVRLHLIYRRVGEDDRADLTILLLWGLIRFRYDLPSLNLSSQGNIEVRTEKTNASATKKEETWKDRITAGTVVRLRGQFKRMQEDVVGLSDIIKRFLNHMYCERLMWHTRIGTGDAAETGVLTGMGWGIKTTLISVIRLYIEWDCEPDLQLVPHFNEAILETDLECMIRFRVGQAILMGIRLVRYSRKGGNLEWPSTPYKV